MEDMKYYIKRTDAEGNVMYAMNTDGDMFTFVNDRTKATLFTKDELEHKHISLSMILNSETIEVYKYEPKYRICIFHMNNEDSYTFLAENYLFNDNHGIFETTALANAKSVLGRIEKDYSCPIRILVDNNGDLSDLETNVSFDDIPLYLRIDKLNKYVRNRRSKGFINKRLFKSMIDLINSVKPIENMFSDNVGK